MSVMPRLPHSDAASTWHHPTLARRPHFLAALPPGDVANLPISAPGQRVASPARQHNQQ